MASIHKNKRSPFFQAAFTGPDGRRVQKSTGTANRTQALQIAVEFEKAAAIGRRGLLTEQKARDVIASLYAIANQDLLPADTIEQYLERWLKVKAIETKESSLAAYRKTAQKLSEYLGAKVRRPLDVVTVKDATGFRDSIAMELAPSSANKYLKIARVIWNDAIRESITGENPFAKVKILDAGDPTRVGFTLDQLKRVYKSASESWQGMILLGYNSGQRIGDLSKLTWQNIHLNEQELRFIAEKTGRKMILPLSDVVMDYLLKRQAPDDPTAPLFPELYGLKTETLSNQFSAIVADAGFGAYNRQKKSTGKGRSSRRKTGNLTFHCIRHTTTSELKSAGVSNAIAQEIVGHDSEEVSRHYTKIDTDTLRRAVRKLPNIVGV